ncbi:hypothetical protein JQC92_02320 [Shewanella sp. 202IG2-18]|uniref:hypothetical protein n=1 Tax=Parashewanella hymeniacidonis TaxID=2807618 RepID=UPI0019611B9C|nr:hypothetical protein [Parashewanella hymeniacidonis]MBM7070876.1 hypothetical protein [Parashewanella hymeniacidonis]
MELRDLLPLVREKCQGMLDRQAIDHLKKAYRKFCIESKFVIRKQTVDKVANELTLTPDAGYYILDVLSVDDIDGRDLTKGTHYIVTDNREITLVEGIDKAVVTFSIAPILPISDSVAIEQRILERWPDELAAGAASTLRKMPSQEWTDFSLSQHYQREFVEGYREAFQERVSDIDNSKLNQSSKRVFY